MGATPRADSTGAILRIGSDARLADAHLPAEAGGKARGLELIARAGLGSPPAWVVLPEAGAPETEALANDLRARGLVSLAVRSSARDEDHEEASFAGIHESRLAVAIDELPRALREVSASTLAARARAYRRQLGLPPADGPCAVVVQEMVAGECSGIAFGRGDLDAQVVIEAVEGIGELAVQGTVQPETLELGLTGPEWSIRRRRPRAQAVALRATEVGLSLVPVAPERQSGELLDEALAARIAAGVATLQRATGHRLDVEWTVHEGEVLFLQARPQTRPLAHEVAPGQTWTRVNVRDVLPEIPSAFARSALPPVLDRGSREFVRMHGLRHGDDAPFMAIIHGRAVFNDRIFQVADALGVPRRNSQMLLGGTGEACNELAPWSVVRALRHPGMLLRTLAIVATAEGRARRHLEETRRARVEHVEQGVADADDEELLERVDAFFGPELEEFLVRVMGVAAAAGSAQYEALTVLRRCPAPLGTLTRLVAAGEQSVSTRQLEDLVTIALAARGWSGAVAFFGTIVAEHAAASFWRTSLPAELWAAVEAWLARYGHRGHYESDIARPRYADDLRLLADCLAPMVLAEDPPESPEAGRERRERLAAAAWEEIEERLGWWGRWRLRNGLRKLKRLMLLRERMRSEGVVAFSALRRVVVEIGRRLARRGRLRDVDDVWHLSREELRTALQRPDYDAESAVRRELSRIAAWRRIEVPNGFTSEEVGDIARGPIADFPRARSLEGNGISPGVAEGEACVLASPDEGRRLRAGAILVTAATDPGWSPLFARAAGIVVELGGTLSHAGIVAREYGIPCVGNIDGVTRILRDGDLLRIDGSLGTVAVVDRATGAVDAIG